MKKQEVKKYIEEQFVEDYEYISKFMNDVNETLEKMGFDIYESYNDFCLDIEKSIFDLFEFETDIELSKDLIVNALNNMIKMKLLNDENYEDKISDFFRKNS